MIKNIIIILFVGFFANTTLAQQKITVKVVSKDGKEPIEGASVHLKNTNKGTITDSNGIAVITMLSAKNNIIVVSYLGFKTVEKHVDTAIKKMLFIVLEEDTQHLEAVVVSSTRSKRSIAKIPTRIEVIGAEELGEKAVMKSVNIAMILRESTGIQM